MNEDEYDLNGTNAALEEEIADETLELMDMKYDLHKARTIAEKKKKKPFGSFGGPKPDEIEILGIDKRYWAYIWVKGEYFIRYLREKIHPIQFDNNLKSVKIFNEIIDLGKAKEELLSGIKKVDKFKDFNLPIVESIYRRSVGELVFDATEGKEIDFKKIMSIRREPVPGNFMSEEHGGIMEAPVGSSDVISALRMKLTKIRPSSDIRRVLEERFFIHECSIIYRCYYHVRLAAQGKEKTLIIDSVDGSTSTK